MEEKEDGQKLRARIVGAVNAHQDKVHNYPEFPTFSSLVPYMTKSSHMVNTTTESNKIITLDRVYEYNLSFCTNDNLFPLV